MPSSHAAPTRRAFLVGAGAGAVAGGATTMGLDLLRMAPAQVAATTLSALASLVAAQATAMLPQVQVCRLVNPGATYERVSAEPAHGLKFRSLDRYLPGGATHATNGGWWQIAEREITSRMCGAVHDGTTNDNTAHQVGMLACSMLGRPYIVSAGLSAIVQLQGYNNLVIRPERRGQSGFVRIAGSIVGGNIVTFSGCTGFELDDGLVFDGNKPNQSVDATTLAIYNCGAFRVGRIVARNARGTTSYGGGILVNNTTDVANGTVSRVVDPDCADNDGTGLYVVGTVGNLTIRSGTYLRNGGSGIQIENNASPVAVGSMPEIMISDPRCIGNKVGLSVRGYVRSYVGGQPIYGTGSEVAVKISVTGGLYLRNTQYGIVYQVKGGSLKGCIANENGTPGQLHGGILLNTEDTRVLGCTTDDNVFYGIDAGGAAGLEIAHHHARRNGKLYVDPTVAPGINIGGCLDTWVHDCYSEDNGIQISCPRLEGASGNYSFPQAAARVRINDNTLVCKSTAQRAISVQGDILKLEVCRNKAHGVTSSEQWIIESTDCLIRDNKGDDTVAWAGGYASGSTALVLPDWMEDAVVNTSGSTTITDIRTRTMNKYASGVYKVEAVGATGWTSVPTVTVNGTGSGAVVLATIDGAGGLWFTIVSPGTGYAASGTTVTLTGGGGTVTSTIVTVGAGGQINGKTVRLLFTGPVTLKYGTLRLAGAADVATTGRSYLAMQGIVGSLHQLSLANNV